MTKLGVRYIRPEWRLLKQKRPSLRAQRGNLQPADATSRDCRAALAM